jgi:protein HIRA/HIR1
VLLTAKHKTVKHAHHSSAAANSTYSTSIQAHLYDASFNLWQRIADDRYASSDYYLLGGGGARNTTIGTATPNTKTTLAELDRIVSRGVHSATKSLYDNTSSTSHHTTGGKSSTDATSAILTRSHCEDRMACAVAINSKTDFLHWFQFYCRKLSDGGDASGCRFLVERITVTDDEDKCNTDSAANDNSTRTTSWWIMPLIETMGVRKEELIKVLIREMGKNRNLQRVTGEVVTEVEMSGINVAD